jgi:hypothetical protein
MNPETNRVLPTLPAFLLGLGLGVGGTWLALPRQTPADAAGTSVAQGERDATTSAPPQAVTMLERSDGSERGAAAPLLQAAPRPGAVAGADPEAEGGNAGESDRLKAFRRSILDTSTVGRRQYLTLLQDLTTEDAPGMMALFREMAQRGHAVGDYDRLFWLRWAEVDGAAASATMFARDKRFPETALSNLAISTWSKYEPEAASAWLFAQEDIPLREGMTNGLLEGMAEYDPAFAMRFLESANLSTRQRAHGYAQIARQHHLQQGLDAVGQWYEEHASGGRDLDQVIEATTGVYARAPFAEALGWADALEGSSDHAARTRNQLHARLAYDRPDGLIAYLGGEPGAESLGGVVPLTESAVSRWIQTNPGAMASWLEKNREIRNYDLVAAPFAAQVARDDPDAARAWADTLRDPALRETVKERIASARSAGR